MDITHSFALLTRPGYWSLKTPSGTVSGYLKKGEYHVAENGIYRPYKTEYEAWLEVQRIYSRALEDLSRAPHLTHRAQAVRGALLLGLSTTGLEDMLAQVYEQMRGLFETAARALDVTPVGKRPPTIKRCSPSRVSSWYEVAGKVKESSFTDAFWLRLRVLPSPIEENTWMVRLRVPSTDNHQMLRLQQQFDTFVRLMAAKGITIKDVLNGSMIDL